MDALTLTALGTIITFLAFIIQASDSMERRIEKRRFKGRERGNEVGKQELLQKELNKPELNKYTLIKNTVVPAKESNFYKGDPPSNWEKNINKWEKDINKRLADTERNPNKLGLIIARERKKILVVDDEQIIRDNFQELLEIEGYEVLLAENAEQAFKILEQELPDLIISDVVMPGVSGYSFTEIIRGNPSINWIPVILVSAYKCKSFDRVRGLEAGAVAYLNKPFNHMELMAQVKSSLKRTELLMNRNNIKE